MTKSKYRKGDAITNIADLIALILAGAIFYIPAGYNGYKTVPAPFLNNWSLHQLMRGIRHKSIFLAEPISQGGKTQ